MENAVNAPRRIWLCASEALVERGEGLRFPLIVGKEKGSGFAVRYFGKVQAYLNRCAHVPIELDWEQGKFFDITGTYLMCSTHGALYVPESGRCAGGPCRGGKLRKIEILEESGEVYWLPDGYIEPVLA